MSQSVGRLITLSYAFKKRLFSQDYKMLTMNTKESGITYYLWGGLGKYQGKNYTFHGILSYSVFITTCMCFEF